MYTPQQIEQISFEKAMFGGYDIQSVDVVLEPLTRDYITLYKENALLKSKMRVLVEKLEEYRRNEASMKDAIVNAQKTCDKMVREAEIKCTQMLNDANLAAAENARNSDTVIAAENERVEEAKKVAADRITDIQGQLTSCIKALERIKIANRPTPGVPAETMAFDYDAVNKEAQTSAVADEISHVLEALVGTAEEDAPKAEPKHPVSETTSKFTNLQFGRNYDPTKR